MNTCDTCKHWDPKTVSDRDDVPNSGYDPNHYCAKLSDYDAPYDSEVIPATLGMIRYPNIATGPKFGCVHHEPTNANPTQ